MDEQKIREIVRDELAQARTRRGAKAKKTATQGTFADALRSALDGAPDDVTIRDLLARAGKDPNVATRGDYTMAGTILRDHGWDIVRRRGSGARERVYRRSARAA